MINSEWQKSDALLVQCINCIVCRCGSGASGGEFGLNGSQVCVWEIDWDVGTTQARSRIRGIRGDGCCGNGKWGDGDIDGKCVAVGGGG